MTESEFEKQLEWLVEETRAAVAVYDCSEELYRAAQERHDLEAAMMADHAFWQVNLGRCRKRYSLYWGASSINARTHIPFRKCSVPQRST